MRGESPGLAVATGFGMGTFAFVLATPPKRLAKLELSGYKLAPVVMGSLGGLYFFWYATTTAVEIPGAIFEVTAQIIPVLILATIVDARRAHRIATEDVVGALAFLILGEIMALFGIMTQTAPIFGLVCGALTAGFAALILSVLAEGAPDSTVTDEARDE